MTTQTRLALAFLTLAAAGNSALAVENPTTAEPAAKAPSPRFEQIDSDSSGDVTFEEFSAALTKRFMKADANGDRAITAAEISARIKGARAERVAARLVERFDTNGDGSITLVELEGRQKKLFAVRDFNDDGKLVSSEMPGRKMKAVKP